MARALPCGDYGVVADGRLVAAVERKSLAGLVTSVTNGKLRYALGDLAALPRAAVVVEDRYSALFKQRHARAGRRRREVACKVPEGAHLLISLGLRDQPRALPRAGQAGKQRTRPRRPAGIPAGSLHDGDSWSSSLPGGSLLESEERPNRPAAPARWTISRGPTSVLNVCPGGSPAGTRTRRRCPWRSA